MAFYYGPTPPSPELGKDVCNAHVNKSLETRVVIYINNFNERRNVRMKRLGAQQPPDDFVFFFFLTNTSEHIVAYLN